MPQERPEMIGQVAAHRDSREPSGRLTVVKSVEITDLCPMRSPPQMVRLDYAPSRDGLYVEILDARPAAFVWIFSIFLVPRLADLAARGLHDWSVIKTAKNLGLSAGDLAAIILKHAPLEHL